MPQLTKQDMVKALFELDQKYGFEEAKDIRELSPEAIEHLVREAGSYMVEPQENFPKELREILTEKGFTIGADKDVNIDGPPPDAPSS
jgi:hypothetical protein